MTDPFERLEAPPVFVVGHHRSGTTWVYDLLTHPATVAGVFESWLFTTDYGLGGLLHWGHWEEGLIAERERVFGTRAGVGALASLDEVVDACGAIARRFLGRAIGPEHRYLVEKSPDHLQAALAIRHVFPDARFINVIRDGRDVAVSMRAAGRWSPGAMSRNVTSVRATAQRWSASLRIAERVAAELGSAYREVSYEELQADPRTTLRELFAFCGFELADDAVDAAVDAADFSRHERTGDDHFRRGGRVGDWRTSLSLTERLVFERTAGSQLRARGYADSRWWWRASRRSARR